MFSGTKKRRAFYAAELLLLTVTALAVARVARGSEWHPASLVALLLVLALLGQWFSVEIRGGQLSASLIAIVVAMGLLGPVSAAACGIAAMILKSTVRRLSASDWLTNLSSYAAVPFTGGLLVRIVTEATGAVSGHGLRASLAFGLIVFGAFVFATALSFMLFGLEMSSGAGASLRRELRELIPLLPGEFAAGALATVLAVSYRGIGPSALVAALIVLLIFQRLTVALLRSEDRAEQLLARSRQLVGLQLGVLRTLVRALGMRDQRTARHAAAVATYAKALAAEIGCPPEEQDMIHTAGLLHDIGKFTWPDRVLHADSVAHEDLSIVKAHPQEGAVLVGALDGYGEVADAILYHHERMDGRGYPAGLIGHEIPLGSRVLAICSSYDTMTARDSYRTPMPPNEAMAELDRSALNGQLDGELVTRFIEILRREGNMFGQGADFETELDFERRVRDMAEPRGRGAIASAALGSRVRPREWLANVSALGQRARSKH